MFIANLEAHLNWENQGSFRENHNDLPFANLFLDILTNVCSHQPAYTGGSQEPFLLIFPWKHQSLNPLVWSFHFSCCQYRLDLRISALFISINYVTCFPYVLISLWVLISENCRLFFIYAFSIACLNFWKLSFEMGTLRKEWGNIWG